MEERYIAAVDLGTSKTALAVARVEGEDVQVIYYKERPSAGVRYGYVFNPQRASDVLKEMVRSAETELHIRILQMVVGLPRYYVRQEIAKAEVPRGPHHGRITREDVESLKNIALDTYPLDNPEKEIIFGAVAQSIETDEIIQATEEDVVGMISEKFMGYYKTFVGTRKNRTNIDNIFNDTGIALSKTCFTPITTAKAVLTANEMNNGVALLEFGAGVTSVTVFQGGILRHYASIPFGAASVTEDIRLECGFSTALAENIKLAYGACMPEKLASMSEKIIKVVNEENGAEKDLPVRYLSEIITCREKEIIEAMLYEIERSGMADTLRSGLVITGGGAAMTGLANLIKEMSGYNVRMGYPLRKFSATGCPGAMETAAATVISMVMACKDDRYVNCIEQLPSQEPEEQVPEPEAEEAAPERPEDALFNKDEFGPEQKPEKKKPVKEPKQKKDRKPSPIWTKITGKLGDTLNSLFDDMVDNQ